MTVVRSSSSSVAIIHVTYYFRCSVKYTYVLTRLLHDIGCILAWTTAGTKSRRVLHAAGACGVGVCSVIVSDSLNGCRRFICLVLETAALCNIFVIGAPCINLLTYLLRPTYVPMRCTVA